MSETTPPAAEQLIDPWLVERLLADSAAADDDDEQALALLFAALRSPATGTELVGREHYLAAFAAAQTLRTAPHPSRRKSMLATLLAAKTVVAGIALVTVAGTAAAAYSGSLPSALQDVAHQSVGAPAAPITVEPSPSSARPTASNTASTHAPIPTPTPTKRSRRNPVLTGSAAHDWCTAYRTGGLGAKSTTRQRLSDVAGGPSKIPAFCATLLDGFSEATARPQPSSRPSDRPTGKPTPYPPSRPSENPGGSGRPDTSGLPATPNRPDSKPGEEPTNRP